MGGMEGREDIILDRPLEQIGQKDSKKVTDLSLYLTKTMMIHPRFCGVAVKPIMIAKIRSD